MALEKGKINATQLCFLFINYLLAISMLFTVGSEAKQDAWLAILLGMGICLGLALLYLALANRFPGQTLIAINDQVWGGFLGKIFSGILILFYILGISLSINLLVRFQKEFLLNTPPLVLALLGTGIAIILANRGLEIVARCSMLIRIFLMIIWGLIFFLGIPEFRLANFQPLLQTPLPLFLQAVLRVSAFSMARGYSILMIFPMALDPSKNSGAIIKAVAFSAVYLLSGVVFTIGVLGPTAGEYTFPALTATRIINVGEIFTRMEVIMGIAAWLGGFIFVAISIYTVFTAVGELLKLQSYQTLSVPMWILISVLSIQSFGSSAEDVEFGLKVYTWLAIPFQYLIPLLTLAVAFVRSMPGKNKQRSPQ